MGVESNIFDRVCEASLCRSLVFPLSCFARNATFCNHFPWDVAHFHLAEPFEEPVKKGSDDVRVVHPEFCCKFDLLRFEDLGVGLEGSAGIAHPDFDFFIIGKVWCDCRAELFEFLALRNNLCFIQDYVGRVFWG